MSMRATSLCFSVVLSLAASTTNAQTAPRKTSTPSQPKAASSATDDSSQTIKELESQIKTLEGRIAAIQILLDRKQDRSDTVNLDPSSRGYQRVDSDTSYFLVSVKDASPYLDGYRLTLNIGNLADADFTNVVLTIKWAKAYDWGKFTNESYNEWKQSIHSKDISLTDLLKGGTWNVVSVDLTPSAANEMGYLELSIKSPSVLLRK